MLSPTAWKILAICPRTLRNLINPSAPEPFGTSSAICQTEPHQLSAPEPFGTSSAVCARTLRNQISNLRQNLSAICPGPLSTATLWNFISHLRPNPQDSHELSPPEPSGTISAICTRTVRNLIGYLPRNSPKPRQPSAPQPSGTLISDLRRNPPELHQPSAPEPSGTLSTICTATLRNLISHLPRNFPELHQLSGPEPSPEPGVAAAPDRTGAFLG